MGAGLAFAPDTALRASLLAPILALDKVENFLLIAPVLLFSMVAHEYAHGYAAFKQGDPTAYQLGRLTWNPVKHIDPFMTVLLPLFTFFMWGFAFGGAKPIPTQPRNFRNFKRGDIIVSLAGVTANFLIAIASTLLFIAAGMMGHSNQGAAELLVQVQRMLFYGVFFNLLLFFFNLLPIPPLDGSHVFKYLLPARLAVRYQAVGGLGLILVYLVASMLPGVFLTPVRALTAFAMGWARPFILAGP